MTAKQVYKAYTSEGYWIATTRQEDDKKAIEKLVEQYSFTIAKIMKGDEVIYKR